MRRLPIPQQDNGTTELAKIVKSPHAAPPPEDEPGTPIVEAPVSASIGSQPAPGRFSRRACLNSLGHVW